MDFKFFFLPIHDHQICLVEYSQDATVPLIYLTFLQNISYVNEGPALVAFWIGYRVFMSFLQP